jgi:hypothetical protein
MPKLPLPVLASPLIRRVVWHVRRVGGQLDRRFFLSLAEGIVVFVAITAVAINWGIATVLGQGNPGFVTSPGGRIISWLLILFGVAMLGMITGALVALAIDFLLKDGQGLCASGYRDHIVVCGRNAIARDLVAERRGDDYKIKVGGPDRPGEEPGRRGRAQPRARSRAPTAHSCANRRRGGSVASPRVLNGTTVCHRTGERSLLRRLAHARARSGRIHTARPDP